MPEVQKQNCSIPSNDNKIDFVCKNMASKDRIPARVAKTYWQMIKIYEKGVFSTKNGGNDNSNNKWYRSF